MLARRKYPPISPNTTRHAHAVHQSVRGHNKWMNLLYLKGNRNWEVKFKDEMEAETWNQREILSKVKTNVAS